MKTLKKALPFLLLFTFVFSLVSGVVIKSIPSSGRVVIKPNEGR